MIAGWVAAVVGSVVVGLCATWVSRAVWRVGTASVPWGLAFSVVASVSAVWLAGELDRRLRYVVAGGWVVGVLVLMGRSDTIVAGDGLGYGFLLGGTIAVVGAALWGGSGR